MREQTFVHAHGTGTPANRTSESHILNTVAEAFGIKEWPISGLKSFLGHSMAVAAGDQLISALGTWNKGIVPRIHSIQKTAEDVHQENLDILIKDKKEDPEFFKAAFLNAKGFGGNNASAFILGPEVTRSLIEKKISKKDFMNYEKKLEKTKESCQEYNENASRGNYKTIYKFNHQVLQGIGDLEISKDKIKLQGYEKDIDLSS